MSFLQPGAAQSFVSPDGEPVDELQTAAALRPEEVVELAGELAQLFKPEWADEIRADVARVMRFGPAARVVLDFASNVPGLPLAPVALRWWRRLSEEKQHGIDEEQHGGPGGHRGGGAVGGESDEEGLARPSVRVAGPGLLPGGPGAVGDASPLPSPLISKG